MDDGDGRLAGRAVGLIAGAAGVGASLFVLFGPVVRTVGEGSDGTRTTDTVSGIDYLFGVPEAEFALFAWPIALATLSVLGVAAAWDGRHRWVMAAGLTLAVFAVVGMFSIGLLYVPAAALMLASAILGRE